MTFEEWFSGQHMGSLDCHNAAVARTTWNAAIEASARECALWGRPQELVPAMAAAECAARIRRLAVEGEMSKGSEALLANRERAAPLAMLRSLQGLYPERDCAEARDDPMAERQ